jgi:hypothetical protein
MTILALSWPAAFLAGVSIVVAGLVFTVLEWQVFKTGCAEMKEVGRRVR